MAGISVASVIKTGRSVVRALNTDVYWDLENASVSIGRAGQIVGAIRKAVGIHFPNIPVDITTYGVPSQTPDATWRKLQRQGVFCEYPKEVKSDAADELVEEGLAYSEAANMVLIGGDHYYIPVLEWLEAQQVRNVLVIYPENVIRME